MRRISLLVGLALVVAACGGDAGDTTSTSPPPTTTTTTAAATTSTLADTTSTSPPTTSAAPVTEIGAELLVAGPEGVLLVSPNGTIDLLVDTPATFAIDDLSGGVLFQLQRETRERRSIVYRVRPGGAEAIQTLVPTPEQGLTLNGAARIGDESFVYYSRNEGTTVDDTAQTLRRYSLQTREVTELRSIGGWESDSFPISISEGLILYNWSAEGTSGMRFSDLDANDASVAANPTPPDGYQACSECPSLGELSHDSTRVVYLEADDGEQAVIRHVASGAEVRRIALPIGDIDSEVVSFDLSAGHLVVNLVSADDRTPQPALLYDLSRVDPEPVRLPVAGEAYLTLSPVTVSGPVPGP